MIGFLGGAPGKHCNFSADRGWRGRQASHKLIRCGRLIWPGAIRLIMPTTLVTWLLGSGQYSRDVYII
jgi:hypothetical protein